MRKRDLAFVAAGAVLGLVAACDADDDGSSSGTTPQGDAGARGDAAGRDAPGAGTDATAETGGQEDAFTLTTGSFVAGGDIPARFTCDGANVSPSLTWTPGPAGTKSYAIVMRDLTLPGSENYHWVIYDIREPTTSLGEGVANTQLPGIAGARQTYWSFGDRFGYGGPCPPSGTHTYEFAVYAFATETIPIPEGTTDPAAADAVVQAEQTASAKLTGKYTK